MPDPRTSGNVFIGSIVTGFSGKIAQARHAHEPGRRPFTSAEHEPHLPALQFHRQREVIVLGLAWIRWIASSTTMPSEARSCNPGTPALDIPPRQILKVAVSSLKPGRVNASLVLLNDPSQFRGHLGDRLRAGPASPSSRTWTTMFSLPEAASLCWENHRGNALPGSPCVRARNG